MILQPPFFYVASCAFCPLSAPAASGYNGGTDTGR